MAIEAEPARSAWARGAKEYAKEIAQDYPDMLNGAKDWNQYSWGGCALIYDEDIARRLCIPSELKKTNNGNRRPKGREEWLDLQARALYPAARMVERLAK